MAGAAVQRLVRDLQVHGSFGTTYVTGAARGRVVLVGSRTAGGPPERLRTLTRATFDAAQRAGVVRVERSWSVPEYGGRLPGDASLCNEIRLTDVAER